MTTSPSPSTSDDLSAPVGPDGPLTVNTRSPLVRVLANPSYRYLMSAGGTWYLGIFMWVLVSGWLVLRLTDSTFQTQLVGVMMFAPLPIGGILSGVVADVFDRRRVLFFDHLAGAAIIGLAAILVLSGRAEGWHILLLTLAVGVIQTVDSACRRTLAFDLVPSEVAPSALALESMTLTVGAIAGPLLGGFLLDVVPFPGAKAAAGPYLALVVFLLAGAVLLPRVRTIAPQARVAFQPGAVLVATVEGLRTLGSNRTMIGILGITVLVNLTFFSYLSLIPVFAEKVLRVNPTLMGFLSAAQGFGALGGAAFIAATGDRGRKSSYYVGGSLIAVSGLLLFALSRSYPLSFVALMVAGVGVAGFAAMQATLVLLSVSEEMRGRAMGVLNMAIGALPLGTLMVGGMAQFLGPSNAVAVTAAAGFVLILLWGSWAREMRNL